MASHSEENERQYRVINQMLSMHASLRDRYKRRALCLNLGLLGASILLCAFVFAKDEVFMTVGVPPQVANFTLGILSTLLLILSIVELRVDWESEAAGHDVAVRELSRLMHQYRLVYADTGGTDAKRNSRLSKEYDKVNRCLASIPEKYFNGLKAEHAYKLLLSRQISANPKAPVVLIRLKLRIAGIRELFGAKRSDDQSNHKSDLQ